jgi:hypothetical protein
VSSSSLPLLARARQRRSQIRSLALLPSPPEPPLSIANLATHGSLELGRPQVARGVAQPAALSDACEVGVGHVDPGVHVLPGPGPREPADLKPSGIARSLGT